MEEEHEKKAQADEGDDEDDVHKPARHLVEAKVSTPRRRRGRGGAEEGKRRKMKQPSLKKNIKRSIR